ncbi:hypothetical protein CGRA01v4_04334 [Colletotrichum graminicola]|nr:hypothetical protein CGRA01v4_04334 [Colletotrichum graminicola]
MRQERSVVSLVLEKERFFFNCQVSGPITQNFNQPHLTSSTRYSGRNRPLQLSYPR